MIKFGTSGWRALMGEEFTFHNVRVVVQAIINVLKRRFPGERLSLVVGYDTRFLSERYADEAAALLSRNDIDVFLSERDAPSQAQAYQIIKRHCRGGINFTASFNPPQYNGLKFNVETGAPALPVVTDEIEEEVRALLPGQSAPPGYPRTERISKIDLQRDYLAYIQKQIDFAAIKASGIKVGVDLLYGTSREYLDEILEENGVSIEAIHGYVDPYFGGITPSCQEENLGELKRMVRAKGCRLGIATDADGDRFGIVDHHGRFVHQNLVLALLLDYVITRRGWRGGVARSVTTTHLLDRIARRYDLPLHKTPVGFKYIADLFLQGKVVFGGEESACLGLKDHLPEKDGIIAGLLAAEMLAVTGLGIPELRDRLYRTYGRLSGGQRNIPLTPQRERRLRELVRDPPSRIGDRPVVAVETIDGIKWDFDGDQWFLLRFSGTEPLIRCYAEAGTRAELDDLMARGLEFIL